MSTTTELSDTSPILSIRKLHVSYYLKTRNVFRPRKFEALRDISFDLHQGESVAIIGRNGAGKSTLLRVIAGIMEPDQGEVEMRENVNASLLSLNLAFLPYLSGRENAILGGMLQGHYRKEMESKLDDICAFSELGDFFDEPLTSYSKGMRARLAFSVAFQIQPTILLIDEVLGVGDMAFQKKSSELMKERIKSNTSTVILVSHNNAVLRDICQRAIWIEDGEFLMDGDIGSVLQAYNKHMTGADKPGTMTLTR